MLSQRSIRVQAASIGGDSHAFQGGNAISRTP
jgi:hypothetical protein